VRKTTIRMIRIGKLPRRPLCKNERSPMTDRWPPSKRGPRPLPNAATINVVASCPMSNSRNGLRQAAGKPQTNRSEHEPHSGGDQPYELTCRRVIDGKLWGVRTPRESKVPNEKQSVANQHKIFALERVHSGSVPEPQPPFVGARNRGICVMSAAFPRRQ